MKAIDRTGSICQILMVLFLFTSIARAEADWASNGDNIYNTNSGNVGIGATDPATKLDVRNGRVSIKSAYDGTYLRFRYGGYDTFSEIGMTQWPRSSGLWIGSNLNSLSNGHITKANQANSSHPSWYAFLNSNADYFQINRIVPGGGSKASTLFHISGAGNVGIGTTTPRERLHVVGGNIKHPGNSYSLGSGANHIWMRPNDAGTFATGASTYSGYGTMMSYLVKPEGGVWKGSGSGTASMLELIEGNLTFSNASVTNDSDPIWNHRFVVTNSGNVGIGATDPATKLDVRNGRVSIKSAYDGTYLRFRYGGYDTFSEIGMTQWPRSSGLWIGSNLNSLSNGHITKANQANSSHPSWYAFLNSNADYFQINRIVPGGGSKASTFLHIASTGDVGIGTIDPQSKLAVNGTITAKEIKVESGWSDFVFDENYDLASLDEVESFIRENKHLPDIPSAKEVQKQGLAVSELLAKQMQKIEELTLYLIELKKGNETLQAKNADLERRLARLEAGG